MWMCLLVFVCVNTFLSVHTCVCSMVHFLKCTVVRCVNIRNKVQKRSFFSPPQHPNRSQGVLINFTSVSHNNIHTDCAAHYSVQHSPLETGSKQCCVCLLWTVGPVFRHNQLFHSSIMLLPLSFYFSGINPTTAESSVNL